MTKEESILVADPVFTRKDPSLLGFRGYPKNFPWSVLRTPHDWLELKRLSDADCISNADTKKMWRIHDGWYDLSSFQHPGGNDFIQATQGTDITELVESSHYDIDKTLALLPKYFVCKAQTARNSMLDFKPNGFYCTIRKRVKEVMQTLKQTPKYYLTSMEFYHDMLLVCFLVCLVLGLVSKEQMNTYLSLSLSGFFLSLLSISSHNFFHHKNNWRMYCFDLTGNSSFEWRISHVYSHHAYPNSMFDIEVDAFSDVLCYYPIHKSTIEIIRYYVVGVGVAFQVAMLMGAVKRYLLVAMGHLPLRYEYLLPFAMLAGSTLVSYCSSSFPSLPISSLFIQTLGRCVFMNIVCSGSFLHIGLAATHHHPHVYHAHDCVDIDNTTTSIDWGVYQILSVGHRPSVDDNTFLSLISFGQHQVHHLFPTIDQRYLKDLHTILLQTCEEFQLGEFVYRKGQKGKGTVPGGGVTIWEGWLGFLQQIGRTKARPANLPTEFLSVGK